MISNQPEVLAETNLSDPDGPRPPLAYFMRTSAPPRGRIRMVDVWEEARCLICDGKKPEGNPCPRCADYEDQAFRLLRSQWALWVKRSRALREKGRTWPPFRFDSSPLRYRPAEKTEDVLRQKMALLGKHEDRINELGPQVSLSDSLESIQSLCFDLQETSE